MIQDVGKESMSASPKSVASTAGLHALILAAGAARRYGSPKALAKLGDQRLLEIAIARAKSLVDDRYIVVLGAHAASIIAATDLAPRHVVTHESWTSGLAESLKHGLRSLPASASAALVMLVDQPVITDDDLQNLADAWLANPSKPAAAEYADDIGAPCILPRDHFNLAMQLTDDRGAKSLLRGIDGLTRVPMDSATHDVDTPEDLARLARAMSL